MRAPGRFHGTAGDNQMVQSGDNSLQLSRHAGVVESFELRGEDEGPAFREAQDIVELAQAEIGIDLVGNGADQLEGEEYDWKMMRLGSWMVTTSSRLMPTLRRHSVRLADGTVGAFEGATACGFESAGPAPRSTGFRGRSRRPHVNAHGRCAHKRSWCKHWTPCSRKIRL